MARQIKIGLNSRRKETKPSLLEVTSNRLVEYLRLPYTLSADSEIETKAFEPKPDQRNVLLEGPALSRMQILR